MNEPEYMTVREVAERLRVTEQVIWRFIRTGKLAAWRAGKEYRISTTDFQDFLDTYRKRPKSRSKDND